MNKYDKYGNPNDIPEDYTTNKRSYSKSKEFMKVTGKSDSGLPTKPSNSAYSYTFQEKAFSSLRYGVIATKADPLTEATTSSQPYAIIAKTNSIIDGYYPGHENLSGIVLPQLMINTNSKLMLSNDSGSMNIIINYLYLNLTNGAKPSTGTWTGDPVAVNKFMSVAIREALSRTEAEMTTQLPWATSVTIPGDNLYKTSEDKIYQLAFYQSVLQNVASIMAKYVQLMSLEKHLIDMGFNREANFTQEYFGLLKKKSLVSKFNALATTLFGEYFDTDWFRQVNTLSMIPSRKTTSVRDPLLTMVATHKIPELTVYTSAYDSTKPTENVIWSSSEFQTTLKYYSWDQASGRFVISTGNIGIQDLTTYLLNRLDQASIIGWARKAYNQATPEAIARTAIINQNDLVWGLEAMSNLMAQFSAKMSDLRTYLDVMGKIGLNQWKVGTTFDVSAVKPAALTYNKILADTFMAYLNSPDTVTFSELTQRWTMFTLWDEYTGIPDYDNYSGGSFLSFSLRNIQASGLDLDDTRMLVPKLFSVSPSTVSGDPVVFVDRSGNVTDFTYQVFTNQNLIDSPVYSRLVPLPTMNVSARIPSTDLPQGASPARQSAAYETIQTVFSYGQLQVNGTTVASMLNRSAVSYLDIQISDVNNAMLTFTRAFAPFRVWTVSGSREIGFGK